MMKTFIFCASFLLPPCLCSADAIAPLTNIFKPNSNFEAALALIIIVFTEAFLLWKLVKGVSFKTSLWRSAIINVSSSAAGSLAYFIYDLGDPEYFYFYTPKNFSIFIPLYLLTLVIETPLLIWLYRKEIDNWWRIIKVSVVINLVPEFCTKLTDSVA